MAGRRQCLPNEKAGSREAGFFVYGPPVEPALNPQARLPRHADRGSARNASRP